MRAMTAIFLLLVLSLPACGPVYHSPDLGHLYSELAQREDPYRNPIIVIPGLLGSKLVDQESGAVVWGAFGLGQVDPNTKTGARLVALPMGKGKRLDELRDSTASDGALDRVVFNFLGVPVELNAYYNILRTLGVGGYRDQGLGEAGAIDYGDRHFTCFQFDSRGRITVKETGPGDGTVLRSSALMDERVASDLKTRLVSPIQWDQVLFVFSDHLGITKDPAFTDNLLYFLLESPRKD